MTELGPRARRIAELNKPCRDCGGRIGGHELHAYWLERPGRRVSIVWGYRCGDGVPCKREKGSPVDELTFALPPIREPGAEVLQLVVVPVARSQPRNYSLSPPLSLEESLRSPVGYFGSDPIAFVVRALAPLAEGRALELHPAPRRRHRAVATADRGTDNHPRHRASDPEHGVTEELAPAVPAPRALEEERGEGGLGGGTGGGEASPATAAPESSSVSPPIVGDAEPEPTVRPLAARCTFAWGLCPRRSERGSLRGAVEFGPAPRPHRCLLSHDTKPGRFAGAHRCSGCGELSRSRTLQLEEPVTRLRRIRHRQTEEAPA